jgi:DinB superfamily
MTKQEIQSSLQTNHVDFIAYISGLSDIDYLFSLPQKWSGGQQLDHIYKSVQPLTLALFVPSWILKLWIGKANRPSKTYEDLVSKYQQKLSQGGAAPGKFIPEKAILEKKPILINKLNKVVQILVGRLEKYTESDLDNLILPHPLLGKITLREMMYFTIYHVQHHQKIIAETLSKN